MARKTTHTADPIAVGYGRKSLVKSNRDEVTVAKQKERVSAEAESRRERLVWFEDATGHRSGKFEHTRPGYLRLLEYIETDKNVRSVIFYELDRVGRSVIIIDKILKICQLRGIAFICIKNGIDSTRGLGANETASIQMQAVFAEHESNRTSERVAEMARFYTENGVPWGSIPFGIVRAGEGLDAKFSPAPNHAPTINTLFSAYIRPLSLPEVAIHLNNIGLRHVSRYRVNEDWTAESVRTVIGNLLFYAGYVAPENRGKNAKISLEGSGSYLERYARSVGAIRSQSITPTISEDLANAVIEYRYTHRRAPRIAADGWPPLLTPIGYWQNQKLRADTSHGIHYYRANGIMIPADAVEHDIVNRMAQLQISDEVKRALREAMRTPSSAKAELVQRLETLGQRQKALVELWLDKMITRSVYNQKYDEITREITRIQSEMNAPTIADKVIDSLSSLAELLPLATADKKKRLIHSMFSRVDLDDNGNVLRLHPRDWALQAFHQIAEAHSAIYALRETSDQFERNPLTWLILAVAASYATEDKIYEK